MMAADVVAAVDVLALAGSPWAGSLLAVVIASAIPLLTTVFLASRPLLVACWVPRLVFIAAGALLGAAFFHLIPESLKVASPRRVVALVAAGAFALALLERLVHLLEPKRDDDDAHPVHGHVSHLMPISIASDALHNLIDGVLIATAFIATPTLGIFTGAAIALHELPRELGTFALCVRGGMTPRRAILVNMATGVLAILGASAALLIGRAAGDASTALLPIAAGNFLYLAGAIIWSERGTFRGERRHPSFVLVALGLLMTALLTTG